LGSRIISKPYDNLLRDWIESKKDNPNRIGTARSVFKTRAQL